MERISEEPVIDVDKYAGRMRYIDSEGYVCVTDRPKGLSTAEKKAREFKRKQARDVKVQERADARDDLRKARQKVKKEPSVENAHDYEVALEEYNKVMGK